MLFDSRVATLVKKLFLARLSKLGKDTGELVDQGRKSRGDGGGHWTPPPPKNLDQNDFFEKIIILLLERKKSLVSEFFYAIATNLSH